MTCRPPTLSDLKTFRRTLKFNFFRKFYYFCLANFIKERVLESKSDLYNKDRMFLRRRISSRFTTISSLFFDNYLYIFHKTEAQTVILRCLVYLYLDWIKSYDIILVKNIFFSCLKMHNNRAILPKWALASPKETSSHLFKMAIFPKFFEALMRHIIR